MDNKLVDKNLESGFYVTAFAAIIQRLSVMDEFLNKHLAALTTKS